MSLLEIKNAKLKLDDKDILKGLSLSVNSGEVHAIMGPNGSGKSTLSYMLAGRDGYELESGEVFLEGQSLSDMEADERARSGLFLAFQYPVELPGVGGMSFLREAVNSRRKFLGEEELDHLAFVKEARKVASKMFVKDEMLKRAVNVGFSGGEKKRYEILQMMLLNPKLSILDETDSGLDIDALKVVSEGVNSQRNKKPFIVVNGALLKGDKYDSDLFGIESSDGTTTYGFLEKAKGGTLLIDEVSEIPLDTQAKILRILIDQKFKRLNGKEDIYVNVRIISSTSKDLKNEVLIGNFREDLFHRLNVVPIEIPSLSSRSDDIPLLIDYFQKKLSDINGIPKIEINVNDDLLYSYQWPGNVRELRNLVERVSILSQNENKANIGRFLHEILSKNTSETLENTNITMDYPLKQARENFEKNYLLTQLKKNKGNISKTAEFIGMERSALHRKLKSLGIKGIN